MSPARSISNSARPALLAALPLALVPSCGGPERPPNVILITLDTVRADHLGAYGYDRPTSPWLDGLAGRATRFRRASATAPWTLPSHASMFTGLYPFEHGAHTFEPATRADGSLSERVGRLPARARTLAEFLGAHGYRTGGVVANSVYLDPRYQIDQGFETWDVERTRCDRVNQRALAWLDGADSSQPFFLFLNYLDAHRPYNVRPRADGRLPAPPSEPSSKLLDRLYAAVMPNTGPVPADLVEGIVRQYDVAIANLDDALRDLEAALRQRGLWDRALVIVTADHGEYFGEKHLVEHSKDVYEPAMSVPLIVKAPGQHEGRIDERHASLVDIPWLVLEHLPQSVRADAESLFPYRPGHHSILGENWFTRVKDLEADYGYRFRRVRTVLWFEDYKFIHSSDGRSELYDLSADPRESRDLSRERADLTAKVAQSLADYQRARKAAPHEPPAMTLNADQLQEMRELGYFGDGQ